ncbi:pol [Symbiodinium sp. CCMP2592]|nr:pol [Symbiodinium sp. CCMP2592]
MAWNVGGLTADNLLKLLDTFDGSPDLNCVTLVLVQEIICDPGLFHSESDTWQLVYGKCIGEFRGECIAHQTKHCTHHRSQVCTGGVTTTLQSLTNKNTVRAHAGHIPHRATIPQTESILAEWESNLGDQPRCLLGLDANETFTPPLTHVSGCYATSGRGEAILDWTNRHGFTLPPQQLHVPSYYPYNHSMQPRRLDYIMARGITAGAGKVIPCRDRASSDHDGVAAPIGAHKGGGSTRTTWGPRRLRPPHQVEQLLAIPPPRREDPHKVLATLAKAITTPGSGHNKFQESHELRGMRQAAQQCRPGPAARLAWKAVAKRHKQEHRAWNTKQAEQASQLDWRSLRTLQKARTHRGWQLHLQDNPDWQTQLHKHMRSIFAKPLPPGGNARIATLRDQLRRKCKLTPWRPFQLAELQLAAQRWGSNKSTGPDGISHEATKALLYHDKWGGTIAYVLNDMLYTARVPEAIDRGITVLLPKVPTPLEWTDTRPITLSSTLLKLAAQLLLARGGANIRGEARLQWARQGRQGVELVATIRRVTQMAKDWGVPTWLVKLDIRKAFDSVWQHSMSELVASRVGGIPSTRCPVPAGGGDQPWEALMWLSILETRTLNVAVGDTIAPVPQTNGIPPRAGGCFLDDTYLWSQDRNHLQRLLRNLETELAEDGLHIHPTKTAILFSQPEGGGTFQIGNATVPCADHKTVIATLGSPITFGEQTAAIIAEMCRRGRQSFAKHKSILLARTGLRARMAAYTTLVRSAALYAAETWPVNQRILKAANSLQAQHLRRMLHIERRPTEQWADWHIRSLRLARLHLQRGGWNRWSTYILQQIWSLWGHMARGGAEVNAMVQWKNLAFWRKEQRKPRSSRVNHAARFNPEADVERALESMGGTRWGEAAQDRAHWQSLSTTFVERYDVPWATGKQTSIQDNLTPNSHRGGRASRPALRQ